MANITAALPGYPDWLAQIITHIKNSQVKAALKVNAEMLSLYWELGKAISEKAAQSSWGDKVIPQLAKDLAAAFPDMKGFSATNLKYMRRWYEFYLVIGQQAVDQLPDELQVQNFPMGQQLVDPLETQSSAYPALLGVIPWGHHIQIMTKCFNADEARYYMQEAAAYNWSRSVLMHQMESGLYYRRGKAHNNFEWTLPQAQSDLARELLKNPYNLDFLSLAPESSERDLERALIANIRKFLLELGTGFSLMGQQYRLKVGDKEYFLDLLFYHTRLHCYVVVELKVTEFIPEFAGKVEFYLEAVDRQLRTEVDQPTIGLLLCKTADKVTVEYSLRNKTKPIGVAEYRHHLPEEWRAALPAEEVLKQELEKEMKLPQKPIKAKLARLKELVAKVNAEEVQKEKDDEAVLFLFSVILKDLKARIEKELAEVIPLFNKVWMGKMINSRSHEFLMEVDLKAAMESENITQIGLSLRFEGFKKAGTKAFTVTKDLFFFLETYWYEIGSERHKDIWLKKLYHQEWTTEELQLLAERWCEELVERINNRLEEME